MTEDYMNLMKPWHGAGEDEQHARASMRSMGPACEVNHHYTAIAEAHRAMTQQLQRELLGYIHAQSPAFFEELIVDAVLALGYAGRRRDLARKIGRSGDGGVDGVIELDELGLDVIYLQAKRLKPNSSVSASAVRDFIGSLETKRATKGIFVTTGEFTSGARAAIETVSKRVVLINGSRLTELMVRHAIGVRITESFQFKEIDLAYFRGRPVGGKSAAAPIPQGK